LLQKSIEETIRLKARLFKTLGDPNRIRILEMLRGGEVCQCEIVPVIGQSQPTVSRHLKLLEDAGLIRTRKEGTRVYYSLVSPMVLRILDAVDQEMVELLAGELAKKMGLG